MIWKTFTRVFAILTLMLINAIIRTLLVYFIFNANIWIWYEYFSTSFRPPQAHFRHYSALLFIPLYAFSSYVYDYLRQRKVPIGKK